MVNDRTFDGVFAKTSTISLTAERICAHSYAKSGTTGYDGVNIDDYFRVVQNGTELTSDEIKTAISSGTLTVTCGGDCQQSSTNLIKMKDLSTNADTGYKDCSVTLALASDTTNSVTINGITNMTEGSWAIEDGSFTWTRRCGGYWGYDTDNGSYEECGGYVSRLSKWDEEYSLPSCVAKCSSCGATYSVSEMVTLLRCKRTVWKYPRDPCTYSSWKFTDYQIGTAQVTGYGCGYTYTTKKPMGDRVGYNDCWETIKISSSGKHCNVCSKKYYYDTYKIVTTVNNGTYSGSTTIASNGTATVTIKANDGYSLPTSVSVTGATCTYTASTGVISLSSATEKVYITATCS